MALDAPPRISVREHWRDFVNFSHSHKLDSREQLDECLKEYHAHVVSKDPAIKVNDQYIEFATQEDLVCWMLAWGNSHD